VFKDEDPAYAAKLIDHAKRLYNFAESYRGKYTDHIPANDFYGSWGDTDELCWAAMWLYEATGEQQYISKAEQHMTTSAPDTFSWDDKAIGCSVLHYKHTKSESSKRVVEDFIRKWRRGGSIKYTPKGLAWVMKWGANRYASNSALVAMAAAEVG
jgi:endoglucanase